MHSKKFIHEALKIAREAVRLAGKEIVKLQKKKNIIFGLKQDDTPVSRGDHLAEKIIVEKILRYFPDHKILSEESGHINFDSKSPFTWVIDPIDGTWSYLNHEITVCVQVALLEDKNFVGSIIYNPLTKGLYQTSADSPATLNRRRLPFSNYNRAKEAVVNYQIPYTQHKQVLPLLEMWNEKKIAKLISQGGSLAYSLACVAKGSHTCFVTISKRNEILKPWDLCAGVYLIRNMGGKVTNFEGEDIQPLNHKGGFIACSNEFVHEDFLDLLKKYKF